MAAALLLGTGAHGQPVEGVDPVYHGDLALFRPAKGRINRRTGVGMLKTRRWDATPRAESNGVYPDQEIVVLQLSEQAFRLEPGELLPSGNGKRFTFRAPRGSSARLRFLQLKRDGAGFRVRFTLKGTDLSGLQTEDPLCLPFAILIGDDDFFRGVSLTSPSLTSPKVSVPTDCPADTWPWVR